MPHARPRRAEIMGQMGQGERHLFADGSSSEDDMSPRRPAVAVKERPDIMKNFVVDVSMDDDLVLRTVPGKDRSLYVCGRGLQAG